MRSTPKPMKACKSHPLRGKALVARDKSISHRALILAGLAEGESVIQGLLEAEDILNTMRAMRAFGVDITRRKNGNWQVEGAGVAALQEPKTVIDCGNSGTGARLLMGMMASSPINACFSGDVSLCQRPMNRVLKPLEQIGAHFLAREGGRMPLALRGSADPVPIHYDLPVPSAQVKSAILLAALNIPGTTIIEESQATRDHTELMLRDFGADIDIETDANGKRAISLNGWAELNGRNIIIPRDPSSAAFPMVAALIVPDSDITIPDICANPTRTGLILTLKEMGAKIEEGSIRNSGGEIITDLKVQFSELRGVETPPARSASMIDEFPILCVAAAFAEGKSVMNGVKELRFKECDRIACMAQGLQACGVKVEESEDQIVVHGCGPEGPRIKQKLPHIATHMDHRIAMSFLIMGMATSVPIAVDDASPIATSFPDFISLMQELGGIIEEA